MAKLREAINETKELTESAGTYCENGSKGPSFEKGWNVENCAEVWSCRQAILRGVKFEDMEMYCLHGYNGQEAPTCKNPHKTFK